MSYVEEQLGVVDAVATGMDTAIRPGESQADYFKRIAQQQADYIKFVEQQRASGVVVSPPLFPGTPTPPPPTPKSGAFNMILVGGGILALAFVLLRKPK